MGFVERDGDLFAATDLDAVAHGVNCVGVMGAGFAKLVRATWPLTYYAYKQACKEGTLQPGGMLRDKQGNMLIYHLASQNKPGPDARLEWIASSVAEMLQNADALVQPMRIGMPRIGSRIGGLQWPAVRAVIEPLAVAARSELVVFHYDG